MGEIARAASSTRPGIVYVYGSRDYSREWLRAFDENVSEYDTLGDGMTAHTPLRYVTVENYADAIAALRVPLRDAVLRDPDVRLTVLCSHSEELWAFAQTVQYREGKRQWFGWDDRGSWRVSSAESKRYDKRWHEITYGMGSTVPSMVNVYATLRDRDFRLCASDAYELRTMLSGHGGIAVYFTGLDDWRATIRLNEALDDVAMLNRLAMQLRTVARWSE